MSDPIYVSESCVNATEGHRLGDTGPQESRFYSAGEVYHFAVREFGRCLGKVYVDGNDSKPVHVGWIFQKRKQYDDCTDTFILETWVTLHTAPDTVQRSAHYLQIKKV